MGLRGTGRGWRNRGKITRKKLIRLILESPRYKKTLGAIIEKIQKRTSIFPKTWKNKIRVIIEKLKR